jgi:hypothetical protein
MSVTKMPLAGAMLAMWIIAAPGIAQTYSFRNVAGNAAALYGGSSDGTNGAGQFHGPSGVALDGLGDLYVADQYNCTIRKVTPVGTNWIVSTIAGSAGQYNPIRVQDGTNSSALFNLPTGIAVDPSGNVFVADTGNNAIRKVTPMAGTTNWVVTTLAGKGPTIPDSGFADGTTSTALFNGPAGIVVDANSNVFVADQFNSCIRKLAPVPGTTNWVVTTIAGGQGTNNAGFANGTNTAALFSGPAGLALDAGGNLYVADQYNNSIRKITRSGTNWIVTTVAGLGSAKSGSVDGTNGVEFNNPTGVAVDAASNLYVADYWNYTIRKLTPIRGGWLAATIGGQVGGIGTNNGAGTNALFYYPFDLAVDGTGSLLIADMNNNTIRIGYLPPRILTAAPPPGFNAGNFGFTMTGPIAQLVVVEASTNLPVWFPIWTNAFGEGSLTFQDAQNAAPPPRFYRARLP